MEPRELLEGAVVVAGVVTAVAVGTAVAGSVGGLLAGAGAHYLKKQQDEQSLLPNRREESRGSNLDYPLDSTVQTPPIKRQQQTTYREEHRQSYPHPPSSTVQTPPIQIIPKEFLVLVVSSSQADFLKSLQTKRRINFNDGEALYEITKYLWLGSETDLQQKIAKINQYSVSKGEESEYDIYLVYIELNQADEIFKSNVDQLDRYDAFRNLADLVKF